MKKRKVVDDYNGLKSEWLTCKRGELYSCNEIEWDILFASVWKRLRPIQRCAILNSADPTRLNTKLVNPANDWNELEREVKAELLRIDWEFCLGEKFAEFDEKF